MFLHLSVPNIVANASLSQSGWSQGEIYKPSDAVWEASAQENNELVECIGGVLDNWTVASCLSL